MTPSWMIIASFILNFVTVLIAYFALRSDLQKRREEQSTALITEIRTTHTSIWKRFDEEKDLFAERLTTLEDKIAKDYLRKEMWNTEYASLKELIALKIDSIKDIITGQASIYKSMIDKAITDYDNSLPDGN